MLVNSCVYTLLSVIDTWEWKNLIWCYLLSFMYTIIHEAGHTLVAMLLGTTVTHIRIGKPVMGQFTIGSIQLQLGVLTGGSVSYSYADDALRWKVVATTLAGPLFPVLVSLPLFLADLRPFFTCILWLTMIAGTLGNLWPWAHGTDGQKICSHLRLIFRGSRTLDT